MTSVIKLQAPFERLKLTNTTPEVALRKAIILQAIIDASNTSSEKHSKKFGDEALEWLFGGNSQYFKQLCIEAGLEPDFIKKIAEDMIILHQSNNQNTKKGYKRKSSTKRRSISAFNN